MRIGYIFQSNSLDINKAKAQLLGQQCQEIFIDTNRSRPELLNAGQATNQGDYLIIPSLTHLGDTIQTIGHTLKQLTENKRYILELERGLDSKKNKLDDLFILSGSLELTLNNRKKETFQKHMKSINLKRRKRKIPSPKRLMAIKINSNKSDEELAVIFNCCVRTIERTKKLYRELIYQDF